MIKAVIIDDEERARNSILATIHAYCPEVIVCAMASNVLDGVKEIELHQPQIVFLDIEMPEYNGFELINFIEKIDFEIVFITAYNQYAIRAFEVAAIDYLLKPLDAELLVKAVDKCILKQQQFSFKERLEILNDTFINEEIKKIALPMGDGLLFIEVKDIVLLEADGAYTNVFLQNGSKILVSKKLKFFQEILSNRPHFFRPHRSFILNINYIKKYIKGENTIVMDNKAQISLSRDLKGDFEKLLKEFRLMV